VCFIGGDVKIRVRHLERCQDVLAYELRETLSGDFSDQVTDNVGGNAVAPRGAGRKFQGHVGEIGNHAIECCAGFYFTNLELAIGCIHVSTHLKAIGKP
jgi:hypothetical protein